MPAAIPIIAAVISVAGSAYSSNKQAKTAAENRQFEADQNAANNAAAAKNTPAAMPTPDDKAVEQAKQASIIEQMSNRGRASTILTDQSNDQKLGG